MTDMLKLADALKSLVLAENEGSARVWMIGGVPARRVNGAIIRLAGTVRCVTIEPIRSGGSVSTLYSPTGEILRKRHIGSSVSAARTAWIRSAVRNGTFAGIARMR
ncbi:hypothetical protein [Streptomyces cucumeris]|uniref:hypothetical protein n=1 Tax=Streptomyces cucumeris TaxID=2962890 RepID=UPI0020C939C0|nr:hypothetical protein [Streptomyces sp. NEAU-Y11]MCP9209541.1 hypothetical protein [Streptomyces sp. NEAU-Y11]